MADLHLYEFEGGGFYAALNKEEAFRLYDHDMGEEGEADTVFAREVPDDELVEVWSEDASGDPREELRLLTRNGGPAIERGPHWVLKITAREWANEQTRGHGYVFGGDD